MSDMNPIVPIQTQNINPDFQQLAKGNKTEADGSSFKDVLSKYIDEVNDLQLSMDDSIQKLVTGEVKDVHQVMLAVEEANMSFNLMMEIRNKIHKAYDEVMKMPV